MTANIFLIGPMGAGKTTLGRQLAKKLQLEFFDSDRVIVERTGADIPLIFELEGEDGFRRREATVIDELTSRTEIVLATGGGAVLLEENRRHLRDRGIVIYLHTDVELLIQRTRHDRNRPLLQTEDPGAKLRELMAVRDPIYRETAHIIVNTGDRPIRSVLNLILHQLKNYQKAGHE